MLFPGEQAVFVDASTYANVYEVLRRDGVDHVILRVDGTELRVEEELLTRPPLSPFPKYVPPTPVRERTPEERAADKALWEKWSGDYTVSDRMAEIITKSLDTRGHFKSGEYWGRRELHGFDLHLMPDDNEDLSKVFASGEPCEEIEILVSDVRCPICGVRPKVLTNGITARLDTACAYPNGLPPTVIELNVPSGKIVVDDDLREFVAEVRPDYSLEGDQSKVRYIHAYARVGMAHGYLGNSSPNVYKKGSSYVIANVPEDVKAPGRKVASIVTDLWWYSIMDYDHFVKAATHKGIDPEEHLKHWSRTAVKVKPGVYRFTYYHETEESDTDVEVHAIFEWVRKPDPVVDYVDQSRRLNYPAGSVLRAIINTFPSYGKKLKWGDMTEEQKASSLACAADEVFCDLWHDWHENGWPIPSEESATLPEDVTIPRFRFVHHWGRLDKYGGLKVAAGVGESLHNPAPGSKLNDSFARVAFYVLESMISFGTLAGSTSGDHQRYLDDLRQALRDAVEVYYLLRERYPAAVIPEFDAWMQNRQKVETWVTNLPLERAKAP